MKLKRLISSLLVSLLIGMQLPLVAMAEDVPADTPQTEQAVQTEEPANATQEPTVEPAQPEEEPAEQAPVETTQTPTAAPTTGPSQPTGKAPDYAFNDATRKWEPTVISCFKWNSTSGLWECPGFYWYDPVVGWYHVNKNTPSESVNALTAGSADPAATMKAILGINDPSNTNTGPGSNNNSSLNTTNDILAQLINNISLSNFQSSTALTGDASVSGNNSGGSATSGAASVVMNLLNLLNAMWSWTGGGLSYFMNNIFGQHDGDLSLNVPAANGGGGSLGMLPSCNGGLNSNDTTGAGSTNSATTNCSTDIDINSQTNGTITNNVDILAGSGNANVSGNTRGGDARSGDATAELNIINLINTAIGAGQTFFGMLNIYGTLNGDILFPGLNLTQAVGSTPASDSVSNNNTGPGSSNNAASNTNNNVDIDNDVNATVNNNVVAAAQSGAANTSGNTSAGNATTGEATTKTNTFNLFNTSIFGENAVLVLINDMGRWVGRILNLGGGTGGALLTDGGAVVSNTNTGPGSTNTAANNDTNNLSIDNEVNGTINNNVRVGAISGDANVSGNTIGGNATSGKATVATNIANIFGSSLSFKRVFGILIINIMPGAHWFGSVGVDTAAGNTSNQPVTPLAVVTSGQFANQAAGGLSNGSSSGGATSTGTGGGSLSNVSSSNTQVQTLGVAQKQEEMAQAAATTNGTAIAFLITAGLLMAAAGMFSLDKRLTR